MKSQAEDVVRVVPPRVPGYRVGRLMGKGASSTVWEAARTASGERFALKVVRSGTDVGDARAEADVLRQLDVEHVVRLHEVLAIAAATTGGPDDMAQSQLVLVLDLLEGGDLAGVVRARGHLSPGECVTALAPLAGALARLHGAGVVHGDLSPGNVLFDLSGRPSIADLGTARVVGHRGDASTWGTPGFVAAELLAGARPGAAADVYALGALGWFCLTGEVPPMVGAARSLPEALGDRVPVELVSVVAACLAADPGARPDGATAAARLFDAAPAEPIHLVHADGSTGLTRRIRESALAAAERAGGDPKGRPTRAGLFEDPVPEPEPDRRSVRRRARRSAGRRRRSALLARLADIRRLQANRRWIPAATVTALLLVGGLVALEVRGSTLAAAAWRDGSGAVNGPSAASSSAASSSATSASTGVATPTSAPPGAHLLALPDAPRRDPRGLLHEISRLRAQALGTGNRALAHRTTIANSPARATDDALLNQTTEARLRYEGLEFTVSDVSVQSVTPSRALIRARVASSSHAVRDASGRAVSRPATPGELLRYDVRRHHGAWRVHAVSLP